MPLYCHKSIEVCISVLSLKHPSWVVLIKKITEKSLMASDLKELAGVSYRQINDWEDRGYLVSKRDSNERWHRFSILDLIGYVLLKEVKKHGIPISKISNVLEYERIKLILFERVPEFIKGRDYWLWTDFYKCIWISENAPRKRISSLRGDDNRLQGFKDSQLLIGIPLKRIIDQVVKRLNLENFKVKIEKDGSYSFVVNGVPLTLEDMPLEDSTIEHRYLLKGAIPRKLRTQIGLK